MDLSTYSPKNILIKMPNWLGDVVMATPILSDLRKRFPNAKLTALCQSNVAPLLEADPRIDELEVYAKPSGWIRRLHHQKVLDLIRRGEYDLGILLTNSFSSAWWFWRGQVRYTIGYGGNFRSLLLSHALPAEKKQEQHLVVTYKTLLHPLGIPTSDTLPKLYVTHEEIARAKTILAHCQIPSKGALLLGINPGAAYGSAKCWLPERFVSLTKKLLKRKNFYIIYFGDSSGASLVTEICSQLPPERVVNLAGKTSLRELVALIQCCSLFLSNDSGPMHIAAALGIPLVALFGSTNEIATGPYGNGEVIHKHVPCSPCYKRTCPIDFPCMKAIEVDEVYDALERSIKHLPPMDLSQ